MKWVFLTAGLGAVSGCMAVEELRGPELQARLSGQVLTFVNPDEPQEVLSLRLQADGTGLATETNDPGEPADVEAITWRVSDTALCLTPPEDSRIASNGREECVAVSIFGSTVVMGTGPDFVGTMEPI